MLTLSFPLSIPPDTSLIWTLTISIEDHSTHLLTSLLSCASLPLNPYSTQQKERRGLRWFPKAAVLSLCSGGTSSLRITWDLLEMQII